MKALVRTTQGKRSAVLLGLMLGAALTGAVMLAGVAREADAALAGVKDKIVFASNRTTGAGVDNSTGDNEIFVMNPDGTGVRQLTFNTVSDYGPVLSRDGTRIAFASTGVQPSNPQGDSEVYRVNSADGRIRNLTNNGDGVEDFFPAFSPDGTRIAYQSYGTQDSNLGGDNEIYRMNTGDGKGKKNLTNNGTGTDDYYPRFSPGGGRIAYSSEGVQTSNQEGDSEVYTLNSLDGTGKKNLTNNGDGIDDYASEFSPDGKKIAYQSYGIQPSNPEGDSDVYVLNSGDGKGKKNLTNNGLDVTDQIPVFSPDGTRIAYYSSGIQGSNLEGDSEIYRMNSSDGLGKKNLTDNGADVDDYYPRFSPGGAKIVYESQGMQDSNKEGENEIYKMNSTDGLGKKNLTDNGAGIYDTIFPD